jgi:hypothetical protein
MHNEITGNLKKKITSKEDTGAKAIDAIVKVQLSPHLQGRKAYIDAVEVSHHVEKKQKRNEPPGQLRNDRG